jgi:hypothetical protein
MLRGEHHWDSKVLQDREGDRQGNKVRHQQKTPGMISARLFHRASGLTKYALNENRIFPLISF